MKLPPSPPTVVAPKGSPRTWSNSAILSSIGCCATVLTLSILNARGQTIYNDAAIDVGVRVIIENGFCGFSSPVSDGCVFVDANSTYPLGLGAFEFLLATKVRCFDCGNGDVGSTGCPSGYYEFQYGSTWYYVRQNGDDLTIDEL